jgi:hypothetical protein
VGFKEYQLWKIRLLNNQNVVFTIFNLFEEISSEKINVKENVVTIIKKIEYPE